MVFDAQPLARQELSHIDVAIQLSRPGDLEVRHSSGRDLSSGFDATDFPERNI